MSADPQGPPAAHVDQNYGAMHIGSGNQSNTFVVPDPRRTPWIVDGEQEEWLARVFVRPPGWDDALQRLSNTGQVVLVGPSGTGRQAAARALLGTVRGSDGTPIRRPAPPEDADRLPLVDDVNPGGRLLFDFSEGDPESHRRLLDELPAVQHIARQLGAFLVVVLTEDDIGIGAGWLHRTAVPLSRPDPERLLANHLRDFDVPVAVPEHPSTEYTALLLNSSPSDLAHLAWLVSQTAQLDEPTPLQDKLLAARSGPQEAHAVARWVAEHSDGHQRSLLLAAAMFNRCPADTVHWAQRLLVETIGLPAEAHEFTDVFPVVA